MCKSEGRFRSPSSSAFFVRISTKLNHFEVELRALGIELYAWSLNTELRIAHRQAYLLSELKDCSTHSMLLYPHDKGRLLKLKAVVGSSLRTVWGWC